MKIKTFKRYLREEKDRNEFSGFVEEVFDGKWSTANKEFGNFTDEYHVKDVSEIYRILFYTKEEINQLTKSSDLKTKINSTLTSENQGHPRFYTKDDYNNIKDHLSYLSGIGQKIHGYTDDSAEQLYMGIIISKKVDSNDNVDFSNYKDGNSQIKERIEKTKPVLSINPSNGDFKIKASLEFGKKGWEINQFTGSLDDIKKEPEESNDSDENMEDEGEENEPK